MFEVTANVIIALSLAWLMNVSVLQSGTLSVISALTATLWNFIFNKLFDS
ncbi:chlorhexidine efflux transporter, partial [Enterobacter chuandaensis]